MLQVATHLTFPINLASPLRSDFKVRRTEAGCTGRGQKVRKLSEMKFIHAVRACVSWTPIFVDMGVQ